MTAALRTALRGGLWGLALLGAALGGAWGPAARGAERPHILLLLADNWSWPHAGALGDPTARTPTFDRIAGEGMLLTHAFCPVPSCSPTRSCLLTGQAAHQLAEAASLWSDFPRRPVFTEALRDAGYQVGYEGKGWSPGRYLEHGWPHNPVGPEYQSFDAFLAERDPARPFFYWLGNVDTALHRWRYEPEAWADIDPATVRVPPELPDLPEVRESLLAYYAAVGRMDRAMGAAVAALERAGLLDQTLIVYTSDNGWQMPRGLANCYDTGCRVPLAVRWGRNLRAGTRSEEFVSLTDLAPTLLELAGLTPPATMTGRSFADVLRGRPSAAPPREHVFLERERHANVRRGNLSYPIRGVRTREFLYLRNLRPDRWPAGDPTVHFAVGDYGDVDNSRAKLGILARAETPAIRPFYTWLFAKRPAEELYDLRTDPAQLVNVAGQGAYAADQARLAGMVDRWMRETGDPRIDPAYDAWDTYPYYGGRAKPQAPGK